jgi:hypothetical protein
MYLSSNERIEFMNSLMTEIYPVVIDMAADQKLQENVRQYFITMGNERQNKYGSYSVIPSSNEDFKDTIFWEYGKTISEILYGAESAVVSIEAIRNNVSTFCALDVPKLLHGT